MINAGKSIWAAFKLNTAQSSKNKISSTSLFINCCTSPSAFCSTWRPTNMMLRIAICRTIRTTSEEKWKIHDKESNVYFCRFGYLNRLGKYESIIQSQFTPTGKKNSLSSPLPFGDLSLSDPPTPRNFRDPPLGVWIFSGPWKCWEEAYLWFIGASGDELLKSCAPWPRQSKRWKWIWTTATRQNSGTL